MDWISVVVAALSGAAAAAIAMLLVGVNKERKLPYTIVTVVLFFGIHAALNHIAVSKVRVWEAEREIQGIPYYRELAEDDPVTYGRVKQVIADAVRSNENAEQVKNRIAPIVAGSFPKYIGTASDDSVLAFSTSFTSTLTELRDKDPDGCYYFMYPDRGATSPKSSEIFAKHNDETIEAMYQLMHSSVHSPQQPPDAVRAQVVLQPVLIKLASEYTPAEFAMFQAGPVDSNGRGKICAMAVSLYTEINKLPKTDASLILRNLLGPEKPPKSQ